jgi:hypothetical protein
VKEASKLRQLREANLQALPALDRQGRYNLVRASCAFVLLVLCLLGSNEEVVSPGERAGASHPCGPITARDGWRRGWPARAARQPQTGPAADAGRRLVAIYQRPNTSEPA